MSERHSESNATRRRLGRPALLAMLLLASPAKAQPTDGCVDCHLGAAELATRAPAEQVAQSVHRAPGVGCVGCHGGDPTDRSARAHAPEADFVARPSATQSAGSCGRCHADERWIRRFRSDLATDQQRRFAASRHGELAARGDESAPSCVSCHGAHDVVTVTDPRSVVHPARVAELCERCHADAQQMAATRTAVSLGAAWARSAHADALASGRADAPSCTGCHGAHSDAPTTAASAAAACARCHGAEQLAVDKSLHAQPFAKLGLSSCVPCHDPHDAPLGSPLLLGLGPEGSCARCHAGEDAALPKIERLSAAVARALTQATEARSRARSVGRIMPAVRLGAWIELARAERALRVAVHGCDEAQLGPPLETLARAARQLETGTRAAAWATPLVLGLGAVSGLGALGLVGWLALRGRRRSAREVAS